MSIRSMKARSPSSIVRLWTKRSSIRSARRRVSKRSWSRLLPWWYVPSNSTPAVDGDRHRAEQDPVAGFGQLRLQPLDQLDRAGRGRVQAHHDLVGRRELHELLLERPREAPAAEVPAVELLQEPAGAALAELPDGLADEEDQLGGDLLAARL